MLTHERFAYLAEKYIDTVFRVAFSYLKSREDADDVTQEVFMKLYSVNTVFESEEHIRNWLIRVTINQCRKQFRSPWRRLENIDDYAAALSFEDDNDRELFTYNAMAHPQFINEANELLICYNINSYNLQKPYLDVSTYRPVFLRVPMSMILE